MHTARLSLTEGFTDHSHQPAIQLRDVSLDSQDSEDAMQIKLRNFVQHYGNALHIYCRLARWTNKVKAKRIARWWEDKLHFLIYI
jgi:hypothetical protein